MSKYRNERGVMIEVPGTAYMDGRDFAAEPPLTVGRINLWSGTGRRATPPYQALHGSKVSVVRHVYKRHRDWFLVRIEGPEGMPNFEGWVLGSFLNVEQLPPIGEMIL